MLDAIQLMLASVSPWIVLIIGAIVGALISIYLQIRAQRPRLVVKAGGGGSLRVLNQPAFFGVPFAGEIAQDVRVMVRRRDRRNRFYGLSWSGPNLEPTATLEPGLPRYVEVFSLDSTLAGGYCIFDESREAIARFEDRELRFELRLIDRLDRVTNFPFTVLFDNSNLKEPAELQIDHGQSFGDRLEKLRMMRPHLRRALRVYW